jgi:hypothetical protein
LTSSDQIASASIAANRRASLGATEDDLLEFFHLRFE